MSAGGDAITVWYQSDGTRHNIWSNRYTLNAGWGAPRRIETNNAGDAFLPQIAIDASGNALAVWQQECVDGGRQDIWSNRYTVGATWGTAQLIETNDTGNGDAANAQIAINASGNAVAVWEQSDGTRFNIWANHYSPSAGWATAQLIETSAGNAIRPRVTVDALGNATAVWQQPDGEHHSIWTNRYTAGTGWGVAALIETNNAEHAQIPQIASNADGATIALWQQHDGIRTNLWANRYAVATGWGKAQLIEHNDWGHAYSHKVAMDAGGNAWAVWAQKVNSTSVMLAKRYEVGAGWGGETFLDSSTYPVNVPQIAFDAGGNALAVWWRGNGTAHNIMSARSRTGSSWGSANLIDGDGPEWVTHPQVAVDASGNGVAVWEQLNGAITSIWANHYVADWGWGTPRLIESSDDAATRPQVAVDAAGNAVVVWTQSKGASTDIWAARYAAGTSWGAAQLIETDDAGDAKAPQVAIDAGGNAVVVWEQSDGTRFNIWSARYAVSAGWSAAQLIETDNSGSFPGSSIAVERTRAAAAGITAHR